MARKEITIELQDGDQNLTFRVRQMAVTGTVDWGIKAVIAMSEGGIEFPDGVDFPGALKHIQNNGPSALVKVIGGLDFNKSKPLLNDLLACCYRVIGNHTQRCTPEAVDEYMQEYTTLISLYAEAFKLNFMKPE